MLAGGDALCRARARASWRDPDDAEAAERATYELLRRGATVPRELLAHRPTLPPRVLDVDVPLRVHVERPDGSVELVGTTPRPGGVQLPEHVRWWVAPWGDEVDPVGLANAVRDHAISGLVLDYAWQELLEPVLAVAPPALRRLDLTRRDWDAAVLSGIAALPGLDALHVRGFDHRANGLWSSGFDDDALATVLRGTRLLELTLAGVAVGDDGLAALEDQGTLRRLELEALPDLGGRGLRHVTGLPRLEEVSLRECSGLDDVGLAELAPGRGLRRLRVTGAPRLDGRGLGWLVRGVALGELEELELAGDGLADEWLAPLRDLPRLSAVSLGGARLGHGTGVTLGRMPALRRLSLRGPWTALGLEHLRGLERLRLQVAADPAAVAGVVHRCPDLVDLRLHGAGMSIVLLRAIVGLERLEGLVVEASPGAPASYAGLGRAPRLERLRLGHDVSDEDVRGIVRARALAELDLRASGLSDQGIRRLGQATRLRRLFLRTSWPAFEGCPCCEEAAGLSDEKELAVLELQRTLPDCDVEVTYAEG